MSGVTALPKDQLIERMNGLNWAHKIDLGNGVFTPGEWGDHNPFLWQAIRDTDFVGRKVLDIGCWDGLWSFEAEKRGASEVYAIDLISQRNFKLSTFEFAHEALNSSVKYDLNLSVYDIEKLGIADFDVVIFAGVYYHLKDPLLALATLRRVMKEGAVIIVEGAVIGAEPPKPEPRPARRLRRWFHVDPPAPTPAPTRPADDCYARFYYRNAFAGDDSNWWVPTIPCLHQWIECNFFEVDREYDLWKPGEVMHPHIKWDPDIHNMRCVIAARAIRRQDPLYCRRDDNLAAFDLNEY